MTPTVDVLIRCGVAPTQARQFTGPLTSACELFQIDTAQRLAAFIAQCHVESAGFTRLEENLHYTTPARILKIWPRRVADLADAATLCRNPKRLANRVYANRMGNGDEASGDGWRYRGRGLKQLTGRDNYADAATELRRPYVVDPGLVATPDDACLTAAWYWSTIHGNLLADAGKIDAITRAVNGPGMLMAAERREMFDEAMLALEVAAGGITA